MESVDGVLNWRVSRKGCRGRIDSVVEFACPWSWLTLPLRELMSLWSRLMSSAAWLSAFWLQSAEFSCWLVSFMRPWVWLLRRDKF